MKCPNCDIENPGTQRFCGDCGTRLTPLEGSREPQTKTMAISADKLIRGSIFAGRYEIIEMLGEGGMGKVFRVEDTKIREEVALKLIDPDVAASKKTIQRFSEELKAARKITHKNVCRMYHLGEYEGTHFITMEYVPGQDLKGLIRQTGQLSLQTAISIARQICAGLTEAHRQNIVHRDLKPGNIMIDKDGDARIMDFGIVRSLKSEGITGSGIIIGTPEYMSPEQAEGEDVDQRSDIYSLGVILYEALTGRLPFQGKSPLSTAIKQRWESPRNPRDLNPQIPAGLSRLILKCLAKNREDRYPNAEALQAELSELAKELPTTDKEIPKVKPLTAKGKTAAIQIKKFWKPAVLALALGAAALIVWNVIKPEKPTIAVLAIEDLSPESDQERLCEILLDDLTTRLRILIPELQVRPRLSVLRYKDTDKDPASIGKELRAEYLLESSLSKENDTFRMNVSLIRTDESAVIWSRIYDRMNKDYYVVQVDICRDVAAELNTYVDESKSLKMSQQDPVYKGATEYYLRGLDFEKKYGSSWEKADFEEGVKNYRAALEIDPDYALAYWGLGNIYQYRFVDEDNWRDYDRMIQNYELAHKINPELAETNLGIGWAHFFQEELDSAYQYFKTALELDPGNATVNFDIGSFLRSIGLFHRAIEFYEKSFEIDPFSLISYEMLADCHIHLGNYRKAQDCLRKAFEIEGENSWFYLLYAETLFLKKEWVAAESWMSRAAAVDPENPDIRNFRAWMHAAKGEDQQALALLPELEPFRYLTTSIQSLLGRKEEAIDNIQIGIETGFNETQEYLYPYLVLKNNPCYNSLHDDPRFQVLMRSEKQKYQERRDRYSRF